MKDIPTDILAALKKAALADFFAECTTAHQTEYLKWIAEAKRPEMREKRIAQAVKMIGAKAAEQAARAKRKCA